jgi:phenylacetate-CoA ligase
MGLLKQRILFGGLHLCGSGIPNKYNEIMKLSRMDSRKLQQYQKEKIEANLIYAYYNVPYYHNLLSKAGVITADGKILWQNYGNVPKLTKKLIRENYEEMKSTELNIKGVYKNHSGGSTGEPIEILQDREYKEWNIANTLFIKTFGNYHMGDRELRLWGSEHDLMEGKEDFALKIRNKVYGRKELNSFKMSKENMKCYVDTWNRYRPQWVEAYAQSIYEFALFVRENSYKMYIPKGIVTSAGTLYPSMRKIIEEVFQCRVFNRYGSREVGGIACNCEKEEDLHLSVWNHYVEILDETMQPVKNGQTGKVYVTTLNNKIMPLIRYEIGDIARAIEWKTSPEDYPMPLLSGLEGREMSVIRTKKGKIVPGEFFIHFIGVVYNLGFIEKFQVIQHDYEHLEIKVQITDEKSFEKMKPEIERAIRLEMSDDVEIIWRRTDNITNMPNGKYMYVYSKVMEEKVESV